MGMVMDERTNIMNMLTERYAKARPRGRDMKKLPKPYSCRDVEFTCSNGWTIEWLPKEDFPVEGFFMGHCMGGKDGPQSGMFYSLREPDGTPHVTIDTCFGYMHALYGRCNKYPKPEYVKLINEWLASINKPLKDPNGKNTWGKDDDEAYHTERKLSDLDYRDVEHGASWRDAQWRKKREG